MIDECRPHTVFGAGLWLLIGRSMRMPSLSYIFAGSNIGAPKQIAEFSEKALAEGKPENMIENIVDGMLKKHFAEKCLLDQPFIKNPDQTVGDLLKEQIAKLGENMVIRQMARVELGQVG